MSERVSSEDMSEVKARLDEIVEAVSDDSLPLDDALAYYEEAVKLGMKASEMMEADIVGTSDDTDEGEDEFTSDQVGESGTGE